MKCMVTMTFVQGQQEEIATRLPAEQAHVKELLENGSMDSIHIAADRSRVWLVMNGDSLDQIRDTMNGFPLSPYTKIEVTSLLDAGSGRDRESIPTGAGQTAS